MRGFFRWVTRAFAVLFLGLGVAALIAWPLSYRIYPAVTYAPTGDAVHPETSGQTARFIRVFRLGPVDGQFTFMTLHHGIGPEKPDSISPGQSPETGLRFQLHHRHLAPVHFAKAEPVRYVKTHPFRGLLHLNTTSLSPSGHVSAWLVAAFGLTTSGLFFIFGAVQKRWGLYRRRAGFCLNCGKNIAGAASDTCPHCDKPRPWVTLST